MAHHLRLAAVSGALAGAIVLLTACSATDDAAEDGADGGEVVVQDLDTKPDPATVLDPDRGNPPAGLVVEDLVVGDGEVATVGTVVTVHYVGVDWTSGEQFDASWDRGQPFVFELGAGRVIAGWDQGVDGMRIGGRRMLTIPPELAYGDRGAGGVIGPGATLVFVVDLLDVATP